LESVEAPRGALRIFTGRIFLKFGKCLPSSGRFIGGTLCALQFSGQGRTCGAATWRCYSAYPSANGPTPSPTRLSGSCDAVSSRRERMIPLDRPRKAAWPYGSNGFRKLIESAMPQDTTNLIDVLLLIFAVVIAGLAIGGAVQAWRSWSDHRRIERHLGRR
jgi:hypothetical protein